MKYVMIDEVTLKDNWISKEHTLNAKEMQYLLVHKDLISKFILQRWYNMQTELWQWEWKWREDLCYEVMKQLAQIAKDIRDSENVFNKYQAELKKNEEQNNLK